MDEKIYKVYWCTNWLGVYAEKYLGSWDSIRKSNNAMRKHTLGQRNPVQSFIVQEFTIKKCPKYKELLTQQRYCEIHLDGKINVIHKHEYIYQEVVNV